MSKRFVFCLCRKGFTSFSEISRFSNMKRSQRVPTGFSATKQTFRTHGRVGSSDFFSLTWAPHLTPQENILFWFCTAIVNDTHALKIGFVGNDAPKSVDPSPQHVAGAPTTEKGPTLNWNHMEAVWCDGITNYRLVSDLKKEWVFVRPCTKSLIAMKNINFFDDSAHRL